jgi:hypothetical protein
MSDDDLIRRGDALEICTAFGFSRADECRDRIAALPAVSAPVARITGPNSAGEYWLHIDAGGRSGGINLGTEHGLIVKRLLDAASEAPAAPAPVAVRVKPLEWFEVERGSNGYGKWTAEGYTVRKIEGLFLLDFAGDGKSTWRFITSDDAKAAAQADYATRIMAAIDAPDVAELVEALRELHHAVCGETGFAACVRHVIPPKGQGYVEVDRADRAVYHGLPPDHGGDGGHHNGGSSDDNGDVSDE